MLKKNVLVILLLFVLAGCTTCKGVRTGEGGDEPPIILDSYGAESVRPGATWRVFLKAQDADGDMHSIITQLVQPGIGYYPPDFTYIKEADREGFAGYLILRTPRDYDLLQEYVEATLTIQDCEGNKSEPVNFTLRFDNKSGFGPQEVPEKWQTAANNKLGTIMVEIRSILQDNQGEDNRRVFSP
ncbi:MAG: hypothetical protein JRD00_02370 [Deltaproteobacteria bacterium]|nr:hypothetical protein [Deltaproteobacteria bacterium]